MSEKTIALIESIRALIAALEEISETEEGYKAKIVAKHALEKYKDAARNF